MITIVALIRIVSFVLIMLVYIKTKPVAEMLRTDRQRKRLMGKAKCYPASGIILSLLLIAEAVFIAVSFGAIASIVSIVFFMTFAAYFAYTAYIWIKDEVETATRYRNLGFE